MIDENGEHLGKMTTQEAKNLAKERGFDLVEVNPKARPSICKLMDYGSYMYKQEKQERKAKAKQKKTEVKGIRLSFKIGDHDLEIRKKNTLKFLDKGHKVKIEMLLRGRENAHKDIAKKMIVDFVNQLGDNIEIEQPITKQGRKFFTIVFKKNN